MAALNTDDVTLPTQIVDGIVEKTKTGSTIAALSGQEPMRFGDVTIVTFDDDRGQLEPRQAQLLPHELRPP